MRSDRRYLGSRAHRHCKPRMRKIAFEKFVLPNGLTVIFHEDRSEPARRGERLVPRRLQGRGAGAHRLRAPVRAPDVHGLEERALPVVRFDHGELGRPQQRHDQQRSHELLRDRPDQPARDLPVAGGGSPGHPGRRDHRGGARAASARWCRTSAGRATRTGPTGRAELRDPRAMYPPDHPYHWPTIGSHADLEAARRRRRARVLRTLLPARRTPRWWSPATSTSRPRRALVEKYFGWIPTRPAPPRRTPRPAVLDGNRDITLTDRVQLPRLRLCWHSPPLFARGDADLDLAAQILGGGKSSRLYKSLVFERRIAQDAFAYQSSQMLGSLFHVGVTAKPGRDPGRDRAGGRRGAAVVRGRGAHRRGGGARAQQATWPTTTRAWTTCRRAPIS